MKKAKFTIFYKSGHKVRCKAVSFNFTWRNGVREAKWEGLEPGGMFMGLDEIESIWEGWH